MIVLFVLAFALCVVAQPPPPIPTLPRSFGTDFTLAIDIFNGNYPFLQGAFAVDYDGLGGMLYFEDSPLGAVPYRLETSLIGHPDMVNQVSQGYTFVNEGRCWFIGSLGSDDFHYIPLAIPSNANFVGNVTINGDQCTFWTWDADAGGLFQLSLSMAVRISDNAPLYFSVSNSFYLSFKVTIQNSRFFLNPTKDFFQVPPGPCANKSVNVDEMPSSLFSSSSMFPASKFGIAGKVMHFIMQSHFAKTGFMNFFLGNYEAKGSSYARLERSADPPAPAPSPPVLHQYFLSDYEIGYGQLDESDGFKPPNSLFRGQMVVDKETGGFFVNIADNQEADVPFMFSSNAIIHPTDDKGDVTAYLYLRPGRCWVTLYPLVNPDFPLEIPNNATFVGYKTIYGQAATLWSFDGSFEGYDATVQIAVATSDNSVIFIDLDSQIEGFPLGSYLIFNNFNASKPDPSTYGVPSGYCWDPTKTGPPH